MMSYLVVPFLLGAVSDYMIHVSITLYKGAAFVSFEKKEKKKAKTEISSCVFLEREVWVDLEQIQDTFGVWPKAGMMLECFSVSF